MGLPKDEFFGLARAKSEALDNIYGLFKQNIKSCNAKRRRQRRRTVKTTIKLAKKATLHVQHTFIYISSDRCFARLQRETSRDVLVTRFMEEM